MPEITYWLQLQKSERHAVQKSERHAVAGVRELTIRSTCSSYHPTQMGGGGGGKKRVPTKELNDLPRTTCLPTSRLLWQLEVHR
jgi:hypothetical protein